VDKVQDLVGAQCHGLEWQCTSAPAAHGRETEWERRTEMLGHLFDRVIQSGGLPWRQRDGALPGKEGAKRRVLRDKARLAG